MNSLILLMSLWLQPLDLLHYGPWIKKPQPVLMQQKPTAPKVLAWMLPYQDWEQEYALYFYRMTGRNQTLLQPEYIVMHYTVSRDARSVWDSFVAGARMDQGDYGFVFGHPSVHFMIDKDGSTYQLLPTSFRCTGAYGLNHKAISIEMVAWDENELHGQIAQMQASFCLVHQLCRELHIPPQKVIGHFEVSCGRYLIGDYLDRADSKWPNCYPPKFFRFDPGLSYMAWLRSWLLHHP